MPSQAEIEERVLGDNHPQLYYSTATWVAYLWLTMKQIQRHA